jgi:histidinol-phosphatase
VADFSAELDFARDVALLGGRLALGHYLRDPQARRKDDGTWVTEADWKAEAQIRLRIARTWPDHNILGEEGGLTSAGGDPPRRDAPTWIVDPIDGTNNYIAGIPIWGVLVALRVAERSVVGVCHAPALDETYEAAENMGARMNGRPIHVQTVESLAEATVLTPGPEVFWDEKLGDFFERLIRACRRSRGFGDFWGHMLVARGAAHVMVEPTLSLWDVAALEPIVAEAGGRISGLSGERWCLGGAITTCGSVHDEVLALTAGYGARR